MAMMISWVMPVNPSHPYLENDPAPSFAPTICAFHLGFSLGYRTPAEVFYSQPVDEEEDLKERSCSDQSVLASYGALQGSHLIVG